MDLLYTDHDLTLQKIMSSNSEMEYITNERNLVPTMINLICTEPTGDILSCASYSSNISVRKNSVDCFKCLGYNLFQQFESETVYEYFLRPILKISDKKTKGILEFAIVTTLRYLAEDILTPAIPSGTRTRPSVLMDSSDIVQPLDAAFPLTGQNRFDNSSLQLENFSESAIKHINACCCLKRKNFFDCEQNQKRQRSEYLELSSEHYRMQDSNGLIQSTEIKTDVQVKGAEGKPPMDLALVWSRKYCSSNRHVAFKLDYPLLYKREYDRIRQSPLSVFDALMGRQMSGLLSQRKVLEVIARPHYNIYPPTDVEEIVRFNQHGFSNEEYRFLSLESSRSFNSYHLSSKLKNEYLACRYFLDFDRN